MTARLEIICAHLPHAEVFADIGCDHGYCTKYALDHGLCERAYACDVSAACLEKARALLCEEISSGRCIPVCTDGLEAASCARGSAGRRSCAFFRGARCPGGLCFSP